MVRRVRRLLAAGGKLAAGKTSFKQRYEEAERRRAAILERLAGLNRAELLRLRGLEQDVRWEQA
jgi:hypothetical protein